MSETVLKDYHGLAEVSFACNAQPTAEAEASVPSQATEHASLNHQGENGIRGYCLTPRADRMSS